VESIAPDFAMYNLVAMVQYLQTFDGPDGKVEEGEERNSTHGLWCVGLAGVVTVGEVVPVGPKRDQFLQEIGTGSLEYARDKLLFSCLGWQANKFNRAIKVLASRVRLLHHELGKLELAL
jgi:hypothetical protein